MFSSLTSAADALTLGVVSGAFTARPTDGPAATLAEYAKLPKPATASSGPLPAALQAQLSRDAAAFEAALKAFEAPADKDALTVFVDGTDGVTLKHLPSDVGPVGMFLLEFTLTLPRDPELRRSAAGLTAEKVCSEYALDSRSSWDPKWILPSTLRDYEDAEGVTQAIGWTMTEALGGAISARSWTSLKRTLKLDGAKTVLYTHSSIVDEAMVKETGLEHWLSVADYEGLVRGKFFPGTGAKFVQTGEGDSVEVKVSGIICNSPEGSVMSAMAKKALGKSLPETPANLAKYLGATLKK